MIGIPEFIEEYNKRMDWNRDILGNVDDAYLSSHPFMKEIADEYLSTGKITEETHDIDNAKIYEYDDGLLELQVFRIGYRNLSDVGLPDSGGYLIDNRRLSAAAVCISVEVILALINVVIAFGAKRLYASCYFLFHGNL